MLRKKKGAVMMALDVGDQRKKAEEEREAREKEELSRKLRLSVDRKDAGNITVLRGQEQNAVETLQSRTFTKWINLIFEGNDPLPDLVTGLQNGENLCRLLSILSGKPVAAPVSSKGAVG